VRIDIVDDEFGYDVSSGVVDPPIFDQKGQNGPCVVECSSERAGIAASCDEVINSVVDGNRSV
jgi:hypothetical protein